MKKIAVMLFIFFLSNNVNAGSFFDNAIFGLAYIEQNADITISGNGVDKTESVSGSGFGIYFDKYFNKKYRFNSTLSYIAYDSFDVTQIMASADYLIPINARFSLFAGASLGGASQQYSDASLADSAFGYVYGGQAGGIFFINNFLMMELGYRLRPTSLETELADVPGVTSTVNDLSEAYLSFLLMF